MDAALATEDLTDDALTARVRVLQRRRGHRYSLDDVATAYVALGEWQRQRPEHAAPRTCLDLGCGLGSVLLMLADKLPEAMLFGVEAQEISFALVQQNIARNGLAPRVQAQLGDLRDAARMDALRQHAEIAAHGGFELVTGTPPYKPVGTATPSPDPQRAHARVELRGGVEAYLLAASRVLAPHGLVVVCVEAGCEPRVLAGAAQAGLAVCSRVDVIPRLAHKGRLFSVHTLARSAPPGGAETLPALVARDEHGARTPHAHALRTFFGLTLPDDEAASPTLRARYTNNTNTSRRERADDGRA